MPAVLTPSLALAYLRELSPDVTAAEVTDEQGRVALTITDEQGPGQPGKRSGARRRRPGRAARVTDGLDPGWIAACSGAVAVRARPGPQALVALVRVDVAGALAAVRERC